MSTTRLFRPVGQRDLDLIEAAGWRQFPPRLDWQPILYPVLTEDYAVRIARDWNTKAEENGNVGYVTALEVDTGYLKEHPIHNVGGVDYRSTGYPLRSWTSSMPTSSAGSKSCRSGGDPHQDECAELRLS